MAGNRVVKRTLKMLIVLAISAVCLFRVDFEKAEAAATDVTSLVLIYATYTGDSVAVGEKINTDELTVTAVYSDGGMAEVKDYVLSTDTITNKNDNEIIIIYQNKSTTLNISGKEPVFLFATYEGGAVSVGNAVDKRDIKVTVSYHDGSASETDNFEITNADIAKVGVHQIGIEAYELKTSVLVLGVQAKAVKSLFVSYLGDPVILDQPIDKSKIFLTATYYDGTVESIVNYGMSQTTITQTGVNNVTLYYQDKTASFSLIGLAKKLKDFTVEYIGETKVVGEVVEKEDFKVTVFYEDGSSEVSSDHVLVNKKIYMAGVNEITVQYDTLMKIAEVPGVAKSEMSFDTPISFVVSNEFESAFIDMAYKDELLPEYVECKSLKSSYVKRVLTRTVHDCEYIPFSIDFTDEIEAELPIVIRIHLPENYDIANTSVYYTPNSETVIGKMSIEVLEDGSIEMPIFRTGNYILAHAVAEDATAK